MRTDSRAGRLVAALALVVTATSIVVASPVPAGAPATGAAGEFTPVTPARILDTRSGLGQRAPGPVGQNRKIDVQVSGRGEVPATGASAVVLNVTAVSPTAAGYLTVYPAETSRPHISNVSFAAGGVVPNMATVVLGPDGRLSVYNAAGSTHVLVDVVGYYASPDGPTGARFTSVTPYRRFDTRIDWGYVGVRPIGPGDTLRVDLSALDSPVPASGVTAVVLNVTVTAPTESGYLRVTPAGSSSGTSSLNFAPRQTVPNLVTVAVPASGAVDFHNAAGSTHVIADIVGYYGPATGEAGRFVGIVPERAADTRRSAALGPLPGGLVDTVNLGWAGGVPSDVVGAAVLNVTVTEPTEAGYATVFDDGLCHVPGSSNLNFAAGQTVANQVVVGQSVPGDPDSCSPFPELAPAAAVASALGSAHHIIDVFGYFTNASGGRSAIGARGSTDQPPAPGALAQAGTARRGNAR